MVLAFAPVGELRLWCVGAGVVFSPGVAWLWQGIYGGAAQLCRAPLVLCRGGAAVVLCSACCICGNASLVAVASLAVVISLGALVAVVSELGCTVVFPSAVGGTSCGVWS